MVKQQETPSLSAVKKQPNTTSNTTKRLWTFNPWCTTMRTNLKSKTSKISNTKKNSS